MSPALVVITFAQKVNLELLDESALFLCRQDNKESRGGELEQLKGLSLNDLHLILDSAKISHDFLVALLDILTVLLNMLAVLLNMLTVLLNVLTVLLDVVSVLLDVVSVLLDILVHMMQVSVDETLEFIHLEGKGCMTEGVCDACNLGRSEPVRQTTSMQLPLMMT